MKKYLAISLVSLILASCSSNPSATDLLTEPTDAVQAQSASTKKLVFDHKKITNADPKKVNPKPENLVVTIKKYASKNSTNPNHGAVYFQLTSALESLANLDVSYGTTDGGTTYAGKKVQDFVINTNNTILNVVSVDPSLSAVYDAIKALQTTNQNEGSLQYSDIKITNALIYQGIVDSYDGDKFNLTQQKVAQIYSQIAQYSEQFDDASKYMRQCLNNFIAKYASLSMLRGQTEPISGESWEAYTRRLRQMLIQVSKMGNN